MLTIRQGDKAEYTEQADGSYSVTFRMLDTDSVERSHVANVPDVQERYDIVRDKIDNPPPPPEVSE